MAQADGAAAAVVRAPLRWLDGDSGCDPTAALERGWFLGAEECARCLGLLSGSGVSHTRGFGGNWPVVYGAGGRMVAPALPLVLVRPGGDAIDGAYWIRGDEVWREAAGVERPFLASPNTGPDPGARFDLLWFGDGERYLVREGVLVVDDLFAQVDVPAHRATLERLLLRGMRVAPEVLEGLEIEPREAPARVTVHRAATISGGGNWRDPERFLRARIDVEETEVRDEHLAVRLATGGRVVFRLRETDDGWDLKQADGEYPLTAISLCHRHQELSLAADVHPSIDPLAPGMRGRLAFDLRSDLVALGQKS